MARLLYDNPVTRAQLIDAAYPNDEAEPDPATVSFDDFAALDVVAANTGTQGRNVEDSVILYNDFRRSTVALVGPCSFRLAALAALLVVGCGDDDPRSDAVDEATAEVAIATEDGFSAAVIAVATDGATPEAARILATAAVRRAPFLAELADRGPEIVTDFVAALVDADPATTAPLVASVVEGLGVGLHEQLVSYSGFDFDTDAPGVIPPLPVILTIPAGDLNPLALAVATATNGAEAAPGALLNALDEQAAAAETGSEDGSLLGTLDDQALLGLGADADGGGPNAVGDALGRALVAFIAGDDAVLRAVDPDSPSDATADQIARRPAVAALLDAVTDPLTPIRGRVPPAGTLALLLTDGEP